MNERKIIGYAPIYEPVPGQIVTQAFRMCSKCGAVISTTGGPSYDSICLDCIATIKVKDDRS